jgi:hypothetical protein
MMTDDIGDPDPAGSILFRNPTTYHSMDKLPGIPTSKNETMLLHLNVRNITTKGRLDGVKELISTFARRPGIVILTETFLKPNNAFLYDIPNHYNSYHLVRPKREGGGVSIYVDKSLNASFEPACVSLAETDGQVLRCDINFSKQTYTIFAVYRPPKGNFTCFSKHIKEALTNCWRSKDSPVIVAGDLNVDLMQQTPPAIELEELFLSFGMRLMINQPTRIAIDKNNHHSATLIDHIFADSSITCETSSGIITSDIADHCAVFAGLLLPTLAVMPSRIPVSRRIYSKNNTEIFHQLLDCHTFEHVLNHTDANQAFGAFQRHLCFLHDTAFPCKTFIIKGSVKTDKPWMTTSLANCCKKKNKLHHKLKLKPTQHNKDKYVKYQSILKKVIEKARSQYFDNLFDLRQSSLKRMWTCINDIINKPSKKSKIISLKNRNRVLTSDIDIAKGLNNNFADMPLDISATFLGSSNEYVTPQRTSVSAFLFDTSPAEVLSNITQLKTKTSCGPDELPNHVLKLAAKQIAVPLSHIINLSLHTGVFPEELKHGIITPIHKGGPTDIPSNYRPIVVLSGISKLFERTVKTRMVDFLASRKLLSDSQFGFREKLSTEIALNKMVDTIIQKIDNKQKTIGIFLDVKKAFDTVDNKILLQKLNAYGFRGITLNWFASYLKDRPVQTKVNGTLSDIRISNIGVPQGSILGPILFLIFIDDLLHLLSNYCKVICYADDTTIIVSSENFTLLKTTCSDVLEIVSTWFCKNKLVLNVEKTNYMYFTLRQSADEFHLAINGTQLNRVKSTKVLGVTLQEDLKWNNHVNNVSTKLARSVGILYKLSQNIPESSLKSVYNSLFLPHMTYCISVWGNANQMASRRLLALQKRAARIICRQKRYSHITHKFKDLKIMTHAELYIFSVGKLFHKIMHNVLPFEAFRFHQNIDVHNYSTRSRDNIHQSLSKYTCTLHSFSKTGVRVWNKIPLQIREQPFTLFSKSLARYVNNFNEPLVDVSSFV